MLKPNSYPTCSTCGKMYLELDCLECNPSNFPEQDKHQRINSYISGAGKTIYEIEQYNQETNNWYIVGNIFENKEYAMTTMQLHNARIKYNLSLQGIVQ